MNKGSAGSYRIGRFLPPGYRTALLASKGPGSIVVAVAVLMCCLPAFAHHGNAEFQMDQSVTLQATVTEFSWSSPHIVIYFDAKNEKGEVLRWSCETSAPPKMHRDGWTRESLKPGDHVAIVVHPAKNGQAVGILIRVLLADGHQLGTGGESY